MLGITPSPVLSALLWIVLIVGALYLVRRTAHQTITAAAEGLHRAFRLASRGVARSETALVARNREVLLAHGREAKERIIEREFDRINETVRKDLANYSSLHRSLSESINRIEKDHQEAVDVPLKGFEVIALNVTKLRSDNIDPREYLGRLAEWQGRVEKTGGSWRVINDLNGLEGLL